MTPSRPLSLCEAAEALLTPSEIAERWKCSSKTVKRMIDSGALPAVSIAPRIVRVRLADLAAFAYVEAIIWPQGPVCPFCGAMERIYDLKGVCSKPSKKHPEGVERHGLKKCGECLKQFTVRKGTIFEESHIPLHIWLQAMHLMCSSKKGISSHQLARTLDMGIIYLTPETG